MLLFTCSGTGAFESAIVNLCSPGERVLAVSAGQFGERWAAMARTFGCEVEELRYAWGETPTAEDLARKLEEIEPVSLVFLVHSETSTGVVADVQALAAAAKEAGALVVVDAVSSLGAVPLEMDDWGLDVVVSGSQKALMTPPGLATAAVSAAAWEQVARVDAAALLLRLGADAQGAGEARQRLHAGGVARSSRSTSRSACCSRTGSTPPSIGTSASAAPAARGSRRWASSSSRRTRIAPRSSRRRGCPTGSDSGELTLALRERHGVTIAGGQGELKDAIFRIGHIGWYDEFDIATALSAVELVLGELGAPIERGVAATRALEVYAEGSAGLRVLVREAIAPAGVELLRSRFEVDEDGDSPLEEIIGRYDAIVIRSATKLTADVIERAERLKVIGRAGVGIDNVDVDAATRRGIVVANAPDSTVVSAAEHTIGLLVALARNIPQAHAALKDGAVGAVALGRDRARRQDARRARLRPDRPAGRAARARARHARRRLRPVRRARALPRARRRPCRASRRPSSRPPTSSRSICR